MIRMVVTWNVQRLRGKFEIITKETKSPTFDIMLLTETKKKLDEISSITFSTRIAPYPKNNW